ncbi:MAG: sialate O-acetylesterase [Opitutaceae bacterium]|nr:sialate O-acetylesterase [Opitutaceae bacterium]
MVLQRGHPAAIWGAAAAGEKITVTYAGQSASTAADAGGKWLVHLPALQPGKPGELVVTGQNTIRLRDVVVGDVWFCAGQSNMRRTVGESMNAREEIAAANHPDIRHFDVSTSAKDSPADDVQSTAGWQVCAPDTAGAFTAAGYFFARDLAPKIGVPVGIVNIAVGGTPAEAWVSADVLEAPAFASIRERRQKVMDEYSARKREHERKLEKWKADGSPGKPPRAPKTPKRNGQNAGLYNGMVAPLRRLAFAGVLWYQGEGNAARWQTYAELFSALITQWRRDFARHDFPFYFVQLANFKTKTPEQQTYVHIREAQARALALPGTGMAVTIDIGEPDNIHPKNKQEVGRRLSLIALALAYGGKAEYSGPVLSGHKIERDTIRLTFTHADGLTLRAGTNGVSFEIAGEDKKFVPAQARVENGALTVNAPGVEKPVAVRYAWHNTPDAVLYNAASLPAPPFRTDDWDY